MTKDLNGNHSCSILEDSGERFGMMGSGPLAQAIMFPLFEKDLLSPSSVHVAHGQDEDLAAWREYGCSTMSANYVTSMCDVILWALESSDFNDDVLKRWNVRESDKFTKSSSLHVSCMPGVALEDFKNSLKKNLVIYSSSAYELRTARAIVNLGSTVGAGCTVVTIISTNLDADSKLIDSLFEATGRCIKVASDHQASAYATLMESVMAFMFPIMEGMSDGAVKAGVPRDVSYRLTAEAIKGAAELMLQNPQPSTWKDQLCSPEGAAIAGVEVLERKAVRYTMMSAVAQAVGKAKELASLEHSTTFSSDTNN